jgi:hypothetical protein
LYSIDLEDKRYPNSDSPATISSDIEFFSCDERVKPLFEMKDPLKRFTIAVSGDFGESRSHSAMERWIGANGGKFATAITDDTTHLVCTYEDWKQKAEKGMLLCLLSIVLPISV